MKMRKISHMLSLCTLFLQKAERVTGSSNVDCMHIYIWRMLTFEEKMDKVERNTDETHSKIARLEMQNKKLNQTLEHMYSELLHLKDVNEVLNSTVIDTIAKMYLMEEERKEQNKNVTTLQNEILQLRTETLLLKEEKEIFKNNITLLELKVLAQNEEISNWTQEMSLAYEAHLKSLNWTDKAQAFSMRLSSTADPVNVSANSTILIFEDVIININHAYNTSSGQFVASIAGRYFFGLTVRAYRGMGTGGAHARISTNTKIVADAISTTSNLDDWAGSGSVSVILDLEVGDVVTVLHIPYNEVFQGRTTVFTGCLLYSL